MDRLKRLCMSKYVNPSAMMAKVQVQCRAVLEGKSPVMASTQNGYSSSEFLLAPSILSTQSLWLTAAWLDYDFV